ncbi:hypothetical protein PAAG_02034 [Paracoccidioides lutzii Pb01]|uniref:Uncharacterized protein n=1 Tax=Paracoccidioides lutzii (strain ATCC MYA-826 / Pb01) TaxID=502779 RepID=C1GU39_PARBA|nr:hypothetical protein PAAG_02034 [Paracoccidioides lutzii Pb01]EEH39845.2 hypothetical protein PAAG_02034 [Paracoccidioides lutzii Pb01]
MLHDKLGKGGPWRKGQIRCGSMLSPGRVARNGAEPNTTRNGGCESSWIDQGQFWHGEKVRENCITGGKGEEVFFKSQCSWSIPLASYQGVRLGVGKLEALGGEVEGFSEVFRGRGVWKEANVEYIAGRRVLRGCVACTLFPYIIGLPVQNNTLNNKTSRNRSNQHHTKTGRFEAHN